MFFGQGIRIFFWYSILGISTIGLVFTGLGSIINDTNENAQLFKYIRDVLTGTPFESPLKAFGAYASNSAINSTLIAIFSSLISLSYIYIFKIPDIRRISIQILAAGYYENFLSGVIQRVHRRGGAVSNSVIIILPSFELVENRKVYWGKYQSILERFNFHLTQETTDSDFGRNVFFIQKFDNPPLPVFIDMPTTLTNLRKIIELEDHLPAGRAANRKKHKRRFIELRNQFRAELEDYVASGDWGHVRFIEGETVRDFEDELADIMRNYP